VGEWAEKMRRNILFFFYLFSCASSVQAAEHWLADQKTGCQIKNPLPLPDESLTWAGECKDGKASGPGKLLWYANSTLFLTLEGVMEAGECRHNCTVSTQGGNKYVGDLQDNRPHGSGIMYYADGTKYSGGWASGKKHGKGTFRAKDGSSQQELWNHGQKISDAPH
jgi:MORN repeat